jgi:hypothetical protein
MEHGARHLRALSAECKGATATLSSQRDRSTTSQVSLRDR